MTIAYRAQDGQLTSAIFVLSRTDLLSRMVTLDLEPSKLQQVSVDDLKYRTGFELSAYAAFDALLQPQRSTRRFLASVIPKGS